MLKVGKIKFIILLYIFTVCATYDGEDNFL